jgi:hypothetical protein
MQADYWKSVARIATADEEQAKNIVQSDAGLTLRATDSLAGLGGPALASESAFADRIARPARVRVECPRPAQEAALKPRQPRPESGPYLTTNSVPVIPCSAWSPIVQMIS